MKKIFYILVSAIVALGAVACNNEIDENIEANNGGVVSFTVSLDDEASRITIGDRVDGKHPITFNQGDVIYATNSSLKAFEFVCEADNATFVCTNPNADGKLPTEMVGETLDFYTNKTPNSDNGAEGIVLRANDTLENTEGEVITLTLGSPVLAYTAPQEVTLKADKRIFRTGGKYEFEMTVPATEEKNYVAILGNQGEVNFSYAIAGETVKEMPEFTFENLIYDLGNLTTAVAEVDGKKFTELSKAIAAVADGGTITLAADYVVTTENRIPSGGSWYEGLFYQGDKSFTLDLGGYKFTNESGAVNDYMMLFNNSGEKASVITITNGTIDAGTAAYCAVCTATSSTQKITLNLENVELINNNPGGAVIKVRGVAEGTELNVKAGTKITAKDSYVGIEAVSKKTVVNIYDGAEINQQGTSNYVGSLVGVSFGATANVYGGKGVSAKGGFIAMTSGGTINIEGGEWTANTDGTPLYDNYAVLLAQNDTNYSGYVGTSIVNVKGGTFKGGYNCYANVAGNSEINIYDGLFNADPTAYIADPNTLKAVLDDATQLYDVVSKDKVAQIEGSDVVYESLEAAIAAATGTATVTLYADTTIATDATMVVGEGKNITLNLNGKTLTAASNATGKNYNLFDANKGTLTVKGGTIEYTHVGTDMGWGNSTNVFNITNGGVVNIENATIVNKGGSAMAYVAHLNNWGEVTLNVKNSTLESTYIPVRVFNSGYDKNNVTIENTKLVGKYNVWVQHYYDDLDLTKHTPEAVRARLNLNIFGNGNTYEYTGSLASPIFYGYDTYAYFDTQSGNQIISASDDLYNLAKWVNNGTDTYDGKTVELRNDITLTSAWTPIGSCEGGVTKSFRGNLEGNGKTISGLNVTAPEAAGFFGAKWDGDIKNVKFDGATINGNHYAGVIVGWADGANYNYNWSVEGCEVNNSTVTLAPELVDGAYDNGDKAGALVGYAYGINVIGNTVANTTVTGYRDLGGLVGMAQENTNTTPHSEGAVVTDNTLGAGVKVVVDLTNGYKTYTKLSDFNVAPYVGRVSCHSTVEPNSGSAEIVFPAVAELNGNKYLTVEAAVANANDGDTVVLYNGEHNLYGVSIPVADIKFVGEDREQTVIKLEKSLYWNGKSVSFENLTYSAAKNAPYDEHHMWIHHANNINFEKCNIERLRLNVSASLINDCVLSTDVASGFDGYPVYYSGNNGSNHKLTNSKINGVSKGAVIYNEGNPVINLTVENCQFTATTTDSSKAAIQMHSEYGISGTLVVNNSTATGFADINGGLWNEVKNNVNPAVENFNFTKIINGKTYVADGVWKTAAGDYELETAQAMFWFANEVNVNGNDFKGKTVKLIAEVDLDNAEWTPIQQFAGTFDGGENAIKNLNVEDYSSKPGHAVGLFGATNYATIQNVTIEGAKVGGLHFVATVVGYLHGGSITNCKVSGAQIVADPSLPDDNDDYNGDKVGGIVGYNDEGYTISDCEVSNTTITAYRDMGGIVGCSVAGNISGNKVSGVTFNINNSYNYNNYEQQKQYNVNAILGRDNGGVSLGTNDVENVTYNWGDIPAMIMKFVAPASWSSSNHVAAWVWSGTGEGTWYSVTDGVLNLPQEYEKVIFCAMKDTTNDWSKMLYQTQDMIAKNGDVCGILGTSYGVWKSEFSTEDVYLIPNSYWKEASARFAVYTFGGSAEDWDSMTKVADGVYKIAKSSFTSGNTGLIFCRMNPSTTANNWGNKWNQTADLSIPTDAKNVFVVRDGTWDGATDSWISVF